MVFRRLLAAVLMAGACGPVAVVAPATAATGVNTELGVTVTPGWAGIGDLQSLVFNFYHDAPGNPAVSEGNGATFTVPVDIEVDDGHVNWWQTTCTGPVTVAKQVVGAVTKVVVGGAGVANGDACDVKVDITSSVAKYTLFADETISAPTAGLWHWFGDQGIFFLSPPELTASFADATINLGGTTMLNVRIDRTDNTMPSLPGFQNANYTLTLPAGLTVGAGTPVTADCGNSPVLTAAGSTISLTGTVVTLSNSCAVQVPVTAASAQLFDVDDLGFASTERATLVADLDADVSCSDVVLCGSPTLTVGTPTPPSPPAPAVTVPVAPAAPTATAGPAEATVTWTAPASTGGSAVTSYTVRAFHDGSPVTGRTCTLGAPFTAPLRCTVGSLTNGTAYTFRVTATNAAGSGPASGDSAPVTPRADTTAPGAPVAAAAVPGNGAATATWTAPPSDGGSPVTTYTAQAYRNDQPVPGAACTIAASPPLTCTITGLTNGTTYQIRVRATNLAGTSTDSAPATVVPLAPPAVPGGVTATGGTSSITVDWTASASSAGAAVTGYTVTAAPGPSTCTTRVTDPNPTRCVLGGVAGTTYTFTVVADSASGPSDPSAPSGPATVAAPVAPPTPPQTTLELTTDKGRIDTAAPGSSSSSSAAGSPPTPPRPSPSTPTRSTSAPWSPTSTATSPSRSPFRPVSPPAATPSSPRASTRTATSTRCAWTSP
ncbi:fibronectin type III domain-containing protein [Dactylosporangium cerinum]